MHTYIDGQLAATVKGAQLSRDGQHACKRRLALFWDKEADYNPGAFVYVRSVAVHSLALDAEQVRKEHAVLHQLLVEDAIASTPSFMQQPLTASHAEAPFANTRAVRRKLTALVRRGFDLGTEAWRLLQAHGEASLKSFQQRLEPSQAPEPAAGRGGGGTRLFTPRMLSTGRAPWQVANPQRRRRRRAARRVDAALWRDAGARLRLRRRHRPAQPAARFGGERRPCAAARRRFGLHRAACRGGGRAARGVRDAARGGGQAEQQLRVPPLGAVDGVRQGAPRGGAPSSSVCALGCTSAHLGGISPPRWRCSWSSTAPTLTPRRTAPGCRTRCCEERSLHNSSCEQAPSRQWTPCGASAARRRWRCTQS